jgi:signal recognition particle subunit SEC65
MYREADVLSPVELELRLRRLGKDIPVSITPLVRQLMDQFTDENRKKAKQVTVENIRQYLEADETFYTSTRIGTYLTKWNILEDTIRKAVRTLGYKCANSAMSWKLVVEEKVLPPDITQTYYELRLQRNIIVHTNRLPREEKFLQLLQEMDGLTEKIKKEYGVK